MKQEEFKKVVKGKDRLYWAIFFFAVALFTNIFAWYPNDNAQPLFYTLSGMFFSATIFSLIDYLNHRKVYWVRVR